MKQDDKVTIHSLNDDDGKEYRGIINGISYNGRLAVPNIYIVKLEDKIDDSNWSHATIPEGCLKPGWKPDDR